jgi:uncharacterized membrane protein
MKKEDQTLNNYRNKSNLQTQWPLWRWIMFGLNILALAISAILSWHYMNGSSFAGCGGGSPCEQVLTSQWSSLGILPVSGLAFGVYLSILIAGFLSDRTQRLQCVDWPGALY